MVRQDWEPEELIEVWKGFHRNRPQTVCRITDEGKRRFLEYINVLENVIADALRANKAAPAPNAPFSEGWSPA